MLDASGQSLPSHSSLTAWALTGGHGPWGECQGSHPSSQRASQMCPVLSLQSATIHSSVFSVTSASHAAPTRLAPTVRAIQLQPLTSPCALAARGQLIGKRRP